MEARRSERVHYRAPVELWPDDAGDQAQPVLAEALDLGAGGMRICAPVRMKVGAQVRCRIALDGRPTALSGKVAWLAHGERDHGMGICFDALGSHESALLRDAVERSRSDYRSVELRFAGLPQPIRARARTGARGLQLSATLPILARGTELSFRLDEEGPWFTGRIADARLHDETDARRIDVDVEVLERDSVRFRRHARYGYPAEIAAEEQRDARVEVETHAAAVESARRPRRTRALLLIAACAGAILGWLAASRDGSASERPASGDRPPASALHDVSAEPAAPSSRTDLAATVSAAAPRAAELEQPSDAPAPELTDQEAKPVLVIEEGATRVLLPFEGTLEQMRSTLWASPYALAITLPHGRAALATDLHGLHAGGAGALRIQQRGREQLLRLTLTQPVARYAIALEGGTLELRLVHANP